MNSAERLKASVIIRSFNEEKHIGKLLSEIGAQKADFDFEVILVDSGSTDSTVAIATQYGAKVVEIDARDFTFGLSLNKGVATSQAEICVIVSAHCFPTGKDWLKNMISPFEDSRVAIVFGKQRGVKSTKYSEHQIFTTWFPEKTNPNCEIPFCNNANAAIRRFVWESRPFNEVLPGLEDIDWAHYVKSKNYKIFYQAEAVVAHVHDEKATQIYRRYYREALAYKKIFPDQTFRLIDFFKFLTLTIVSDSSHALHDGKFLNEFFSIVSFRTIQFWSTYKAHAFQRPIAKEMQQRLYYPQPPKLPRAFRNTGNGQATSRGQPQPVIMDISRPLSSDLPVWPGAKPFQLNWQKRMECDHVNDSSISMNIHTGTHLDAPYHFLETGKRMSDVALSTLVGRACVIESRMKGALDVDFFIKAQIPPGTKRLLLKTLNSFENSVREFNRDFVAITPKSAKWLVDQGIALIGIDGPSIQSFHDVDNSTHEILLGSDVVVLEGLRLTDVSPGIYTLIALPLSIPEAEGAPVRAILTTKETGL